MSFWLLPTPLETADPRPWATSAELASTRPGGNDFYGVIRTEVLRRVDPHNSYYNADRTFVDVPVPPGAVRPGAVRSSTSDATTRSVPPGRPTGGAGAVVLDPAPGEPPSISHGSGCTSSTCGGFVRAIRRAPLTSAERNRCLAEVARWFWSCLPPGRSSRPEPVGPVTGPHGSGDADATRSLATWGERPCGWRRTATSAWATSGTRASLGGVPGLHA